LRYIDPCTNFDKNLNRRKTVTINPTTNDQTSPAGYIFHIKDQNNVKGHLWKNAALAAKYGIVPAVTLGLLTGTSFAYNKIVSDYSFSSSIFQSSLLNTIATVALGPKLVELASKVADLCDKNTEYHLGKKYELFFIDKEASNMILQAIDKETAVVKASR
jgi:hypothetical protein